MELNKEKFVYWVQERDCVRVLKEGGLPPPWSIDPVFQNTYFCNVDREHDKVTRWIREQYDYLPEEYRVPWYTLWYWWVLVVFSVLVPVVTVGYLYFQWCRVWFCREDRVASVVPGTKRSVFVSRIYITNGAKQKQSLSSGNINSNSNR